MPDPMADTRNRKSGRALKSCSMGEERFRTSGTPRADPGVPEHLYKGKVEEDKPAGMAGTIFPPFRNTAIREQLRERGWTLRADSAGAE